MVQRHWSSWMDRWDSGVWLLPLPFSFLPHQPTLENTIPTTHLWSQAPKGPSFTLRILIPWGKDTVFFGLDYTLGGQGQGGENIEVLALNISEILKTQMKIQKYVEVVSCLRKSSYMEKCHVSSKEIMLMADNKSIHFILSRIRVVIIAHKCILLHESPWWRKVCTFLLKTMLKLWEEFVEIWADLSTNS